MKKIITSILVGMILLLSQQAIGQFGDLINKVKDSVVKDDPTRQLPPVYTFDYEYHMENEYKGKVQKYLWLMTKDASVMAWVEDRKDERRILLWDHNIKKAKMYLLDSDNAKKPTGNKAMMGTPYIDMEKLCKKMQEKNENKYSIVPTGKTKTIAGFECKEFKTSDKKNTGYVYTTTESGITGFNLVGFGGVSMPKSVANMQGLQDGLLMELTSHDKNKPKKNAINMRCVKLVKSDYKIVNAEFHKAGAF